MMRCLLNLVTDWCYSSWNWLVFQGSLDHFRVLPNTVFTLPWEFFAFFCLVLFFLIWMFHLCIDAAGSFFFLWKKKKSISLLTFLNRLFLKHLFCFCAFCTDHHLMGITHLTVRASNLVTGCWYSSWNWLVFQDNLDHFRVLPNTVFTLPLGLVMRVFFIFLSGDLHFNLHVAFMHRYTGRFF